MSSSSDDLLAKICGYFFTLLPSPLMDSGWQRDERVIRKTYVCKNLTLRQIERIIIMQLLVFLCTANNLFEEMVSLEEGGTVYRLTAL